MTNKLTVSNEFIRKIALENGFKLKEQGIDLHMDLNPYVYDFARALIASVSDPEQIMQDNIDTHNETVKAKQIKEFCFWMGYRGEQLPMYATPDDEAEWDQGRKDRLREKGDE